MDLFGPKPAVQALIALVLEDRIVLRRFHAGPFGCLREGLVVRDHFAADGQPLLIFRQGVVPFDQLLLAGLDRKIGLPDRNDLLARVAVHHNEVTRITG